MRKLLHVDRWGVVLSLACAVHCLAAPLVFALLPTLALALHSFEHPLRPLAMALLRWQRYDQILVAAAVTVAALSLAWGWRRHRHWRPWCWLLLALPAFAFGLGAGSSRWLHALALAMGGVCTARAHWHNLRLRTAQPPGG